MILLRELNQETQKLLKRISRSSKFSQVRNRARCIILSYQGVSIAQLMQLFGVNRRTIYNWLNQWKKRRLISSYNEKGRGRKTKLSQEQSQQVKQWIKE
jgi:transposase